MQLPARRARFVELAACDRGRDLAERCEAIVGGRKEWEAQRTESTEFKVGSCGTCREGFPSAHASSSFAAARAFGALVPASPLYVIAALMALSRVYLGVHYPSDIVAGWAVAMAWVAVVFLSVYRVHGRPWRARVPGSG